MPDSAIRIGELDLFPHRELRRGAEPLTIGGRALAVLSELAEADGALVTKDQLMERVWPEAVVEDNALQSQVSQLRKIMGAEAARLVAVHGRGYRLAIDSPPRLPASVAVLPFANLTGDPGNTYLGDGMAEEAGFGNETIPRIGNRLIGDIPAVHDKEAGTRSNSSLHVSRRALVGGGMAAAVGGAAGLWWFTRDRTDPRVAKLLGDGKRILREGWPGSEAQGVNLFRQAAELDPRNDEAWGFLALALRNVIEQAPPKQTAAAVLECESAARRALAINPKEGNALTALAMMRPEFGNWAEAEASLSHVLKVAPDNLAAMAHLGLLFQSVGRTRDSGVLNDRVVALDPLSPVYQFRRALRLWILGRIAEADQTIDRALQLWPRHPAMWNARIMIFAFTGRAGAAEQLLDDIPMRPSTYTRASGELWRVSLRALGSGSPADVAAAVKANIASVPQSSGYAGRAVMVLAKLGELDGAFAAAEGFLLRRGPLIGSLRTAGEDMQVNDGNWRRTMNLFTPATAAMRADPRFKGLCDGMGMTAYWRKRGIWPDPMFRLTFRPA